jgi:hypothetical protein
MMMNNCQHQHQGKPHTQDAATSTEDAITNTVRCTLAKLKYHVYVPEESDEFHAQEATGCHQEGRESHQVPVLARGAVRIMRPFQG